MIKSVLPKVRLLSPLTSVFAPNQLISGVKICRVTVSESYASWNWCPEASDGMTAVHDPQPLFAFGVIADVQYADFEDGYNYSRTTRRYYRGALDMLKVAINFWKKEAKHEPRFILQLGDSIDGLNKRKNISDSSLSTVLDLFAQIQKPIYHVFGNHEYYNFTKEYLRSSKLFSGNELHCMPVPNKVFYTARPHPGVLVIALDCYELSVIGCPEGTPEYNEALTYLENNPNDDKNSGEGLSLEMKRFMKYNGALSKGQLDWLEKNLQMAERKKENVIVIGHCGVYMAATHPSCLCWNATEVMELLHKYNGSVMCYLSGHDHDGGKAYDEDGILHVAYPGVLENNDDADFGTVYVYGYRMEIIGHGRVQSLTLPLRYNLESKTASQSQEVMEDGMFRENSNENQSHSIRCCSP